jgi:hypothetical protein
MTRGYRRPDPSTLERAFIKARNSSEWLTDSDAAALWHGRDLSLYLDLLFRRQTSIDGMPDVTTRDLADMSGRYAQLLRELGFTPAARHRMGLWDETVDDAFAQVVALASAAGDTAQ